MEQKTKIDAPEGKQDLVITREFDLPLSLLFRAYTEPEFLEQWMGTKVLRMENNKYGFYEFETIDPKGNKFRFSGAVHEFRQDSQIIRTFEFANMGFGVQLEILDFKELTEVTSSLHIHSIYESAAQRDKVIKMGMAPGINWAHSRLQEIGNKLK